MWLLIIIINLLVEYYVCIYIYIYLYEAIILHSVLINSAI
uniref:Uncharacterized protein n=1 Tax=Lepeophtheirus salmonis TaxID=72036 RepID=A0A0K2UZQ1_LEPSM